MILPLPPGPIFSAAPIVMDSPATHPISVLSTRLAERRILAPDPYLHREPGRIYSPLTDRTLEPGDDGWEPLVRLLDDSASIADLEARVREALVAAGWLIDVREDPSHRHRLMYVSLEAHTVCNQKCYFCPVADAPRKSYFMPTELFERIVGELTAYRDSLEGVVLINYNEPTVDPRFVDQCRTLIDAGLPLAVNTNGSGLTPARVDALRQIGLLRFLLINLSTIDPDEYRRTRGVGHLQTVIENVDYANRHQVAEEMVILVLGEDDESHERNFTAISRRFAGGTFEVRRFDLMDRAGRIEVGKKPPQPHSCLAGCDNLGSRPLQHLHITPQGRCVLCCEDYDENHVVGDLREQNVKQILSGEALARLRRWVYGQEEAPADFMCRHCIYARPGP